MLAQVHARGAMLSVHAVVLLGLYCQMREEGRLRAFVKAAISPQGWAYDAEEAIAILITGKCQGLGSGRSEKRLPAARSWSRQALACRQVGDLQLEVRARALGVSRPGAPSSSLAPPRHLRPFRPQPSTQAATSRRHAWWRRQTGCTTKC